MNKKLRIALTGNPNSGKTTIFNSLTGARQHVGNYPGVTVEKKAGRCEYKGYEIMMYDLPGIYSLTAYSEEERIAREFLLKEPPDLVIDIVDSTNLERNLYLLVQMMEMDLQLVVALNMSDELRQIGIDIDKDALSRALQLPVVPTVGHRAVGMQELLDTAIQTCENNGQKSAHPQYSEAAEAFIAKATALIQKHGMDRSGCPERYMAVNLLEKDKYSLQKMRAVYGEKEPFFTELEALWQQEEDYFKEDPEIIMTNERYDYITGICKNAVIRHKRIPETFSDKVDRVLTNRVIGIPIFLAMMYLVFSATFAIGEYPMMLLENLFELLGHGLEQILPASIFRSMLVEGVVGGVGGVLVFLPNIMILFLAISILEDSGYMARAAYLMDKVMKFIGLEGRAFVPMLVGFGCTVPAILATRSLKSKREKITTMLVLPLMSCGARFPIYTMIIAAFFPVRLSGPVLWSIYIFGILLAIILAKIIRLTMFKGAVSPFILEMPPYRWPTLKGLLLHTWQRAFMYIKKAGTIILGISIVLWFLSSFPNPPANMEDTAYEQISALEYSIAGRIGKGLEPLFKPIGFDWKITTAFLGAFAAKEVFVSQMGIIYSIEREGEEEMTLRAILRSHYNMGQGISIILFALIATPCIATVAVTKQESGRLRWALAQWLGLTVAAYLICLIFYQFYQFAV